jgi:hypothetical protein
MPSLVPSLLPSDLSATLQVVVAFAIFPIGGLAVLFSLIYLGGEVVRPRTVRGRLRGGLLACTLVIALALLDIYLALSIS